MEDVMDMCPLRKLKPICERTNSLVHLVWHELLRRKLRQGTIVDRHRGTLIQAEPHPIADLELQVLVLLAMHRLHDALRLKKTTVHLGKEDVTVAVLLINSHRWHAAVDNFECCSLQCHLE
jgi:hypothetical protein